VPSLNTVCKEQLGCTRNLTSQSDSLCLSTINLTASLPPYSLSYHVSVTPEPVSCRKPYGLSAPRQLPYSLSRIICPPPSNTVQSLADALPPVKYRTVSYGCSAPRQLPYSLSRIICPPPSNTVQSLADALPPVKYRTVSYGCSAPRQLPYSLSRILCPPPSTTVQSLESDSPL